jgi:hypothetical protein
MSAFLLRQLADEIEQGKLKVTKTTTYDGAEFLVVPGSHPIRLSGPDPTKYKIIIEIEANDET